ncbi:Subtilisin E precursor [Planctomycetes bacterium MalM25]|nr:Subtilisin E precursor [Planctomycetes bacterium MalM25]
MARRSRRRQTRPQTPKPRKHETLEARVVMSANPLGGPMMGHHSIVDEEPMLSQHGSGPSMGHAIVESAPAVDPDADFWIERVEDIGWEEVDEQFDRIEQLLNEAHDLTGQDEVVNRYGFDGTGQTVAVIDSGIAYNHYALGGGVGEGYRVVGGWDFTENDADFYDDGPEGSHGTHVAGIVGAVGDGAHSGVATGVDMVGLRVFDDAGNGYFSWVEQALQWVHTNRNAFDNPITSVNLSLGTEWNSDSVPSWAMLENEFAQLEADGIFVSVSAGNSYADYNTKGVSYPAASDHVIPVMATGNDGQLAPFSQRAEYAIAAPGRWITSTVPDYAANDGDTIDDDWLSMSGTSMAAPYVAGASMLIREAMDFVGQTGVDQWDIYDHMMATADTFYDSATDTNYQRLNLEAAIDALMPEDDFGSSVATAHNLGTLNDSSGSNPLSLVSGAITTLDDADYFTFTAGATGTVTVTANGMTHGMVAEWDAWGGSWNDQGGGSCVLDVVAGQTYTVALSSSDGLGYYDLDMSLTQSPDEQAASVFATARDLDQQNGYYSNGNEFENYGGRGEKWFQAADKSWHFITPDGAVHAWDGGIGANGSLTASLSATHHENLELVYDAPDTGVVDSGLFATIDSVLGLTLPEGNSASGGVQWLGADSGYWYFVDAEGGLYEWQAGKNLDECVLLVELDSSVHSSPELLTEASAANASVEQIAYDVNQQLDLNFVGSYYESFAGWGEKWLRSNANAQWYFITSDGNLYQFTNIASLAENPLVATLTGDYFTDPSLLYAAAAPSTLQVAFDEAFGVAGTGTGAWNHGSQATEGVGAMREELALGLMNGSAGRTQTAIESMSYGAKASAVQPGRDSMLFKRLEGSVATEDHEESSDEAVVKDRIGDKQAVDEVLASVDAKTFIEF